MSVQPSYLITTMKNHQSPNLLLLTTILLLLSLLLLTPLNSFALSEDIRKPVEIEANSAFFSKKKGYAIYEGNVQIKQGSMLIRAWKIELFAPNSNIIKIVAAGSPVKFRQRMDDGKIAQGTAKRMIYLIRDKTINFSGGAQLSQGKDSFRSNVITYSLRTGELKAGHNDPKNHKAHGRVKAIFYPSN